MSWVEKKDNWAIIYEDEIIETFRIYSNAVAFIRKHNQDYFNKLRLEEIE